MRKNICKNYLNKKKTGDNFFYVCRDWQNQRAACEQSSFFFFRSLRNFPLAFNNNVDDKLYVFFSVSFNHSILICCKMLRPFEEEKVMNQNLCL